MDGHDHRPPEASTGNRHQLTSVQRVGEGEHRQLYARDARLPADAPLVFIDRGQADSLRSDCRAGYLVCPVPGCSDPRYTTRGGLRRDHFVHMVAPQDKRHGPERWFHIVAKHLIGEWLRAAYPEARVRVDDEALDDGQRPDVLATLQDGTRFAFEVQYSPITLAEWMRRHEGYVAEGVQDVWLFGHTRPHLRQFAVDGAGPHHVVETLHNELVERGFTVRWIDPDERAVLTLLPRTRGRRFGRENVVDLSSDLLTDCRLADGQLITPTDVREAEQQAALAAAAAAEEAERARLDAERSAADRRRADAQAKEYVRLASIWDRERARIVEKYGAVPAVIDELSVGGDVIKGYHPAHWQFNFVMRFIHRQVGRMFTFHAAMRAFSCADSSAITRYLLRLRELNIVRFWTSSSYYHPDRSRVSGKVIVIGEVFSQSADSDSPWAGLRLAERIIVREAQSRGLRCDVKHALHEPELCCWVRDQRGCLRWLFAFPRNGPPTDELVLEKRQICMQRAIADHWLWPLPGKGPLPGAPRYHSVTHGMHQTAVWLGEETHCDLGTFVASVLDGPTDEHDRIGDGRHVHQELGPLERLADWMAGGGLLVSVKLTARFLPSPRVLDYLLLTNDRLAFWEADLDAQLCAFNVVEIIDREADGVEVLVGDGRVVRLEPVYLHDDADRLAAWLSLKAAGRVQRHYPSDGWTYTGTP